MASLNEQTGIGYDVVRTSVDKVFNNTMKTVDQHPNIATAENSTVFKQDSTSNSALIISVPKGPGAFEARAEEADVSEGSPRFGGPKTYTVVNYSRAIDISKNFFDDNEHSAWEIIVQKFARRAKTTRDKGAFATYRNARTTATTYDGTALLSDSHTNQNGDTVDNLLAASTFSGTTLETGIVQLAELKDQDGEIDGSLATCLVVPLALYKDAVEVCESELRANTANNDMNVYSDKYGIRIYTSPYLGAAAGGSDTAWFLLSDNHSVTRVVRQPVQTTLVDWTIARNNNYVYKGEFREANGATSFEGIVGSAGA